MNIWYYAHSMETYNTEQEAEELALLDIWVYNGMIYNPNRAYIQRHREPMKACIDVLHDPLITALVFSSVFGVITQGVYFEIRVAQKLEKPIFFLDPGGECFPSNGTLTKIPKTKPMKWSVQYAGH